MSIIIHFNTASFIQSSLTLPSTPSCISRARTKFAMVPGIDHTDRTVMTDDESSMVDIATSNTLYTHTVYDLKNTSHVLGSCFGLPYQDHNYGAPPPPTPPSYSPCTSPAHANGVPDEDTNLSVVSTSTTNEETQEGSITRCICGFEHDDEYMICCDLCLVWQHVDCMGLDRNNIPETYLCEKCEPRKVDRHKAKVLQTRKKVAMTDSSDSDEDTGIKNADRKQKSRSKRKRRDEEKSDKLEQGSGKRSKQMPKHTKERIEAKRTKLRRTKNKESTSTADEEAQDAWEVSLEWCEKNFETALNNQYTPEVQLLARTLPLQGYESKFMELLLTRHCQVIDENQKRLISIYDIPRDQPLIEYVGKFLLASQFYEIHPAFSRRLFPFVIFYSLDQEEICVDASVYGNEARFVRRSCKPNAEMRHMVHDGNLHLYISSTKAVFKDDEITLPLDFNLKESVKDIECACESEDCILKFHQKNGTVDICQEKRKRGRKSTFSADDDSSHSLGLNASPTKLKSKTTNEQAEGKSDLETEEQANERKKKTREERKIDAIMRAFDQMEKAAKRRQQALERQKAHQPKSEESSEKSECASVSKEDDKVATASGSETQCGEDDKTHIPTPKTKKGKRRRGSGTPARRRTRTNSGGSDILSPEENVILKSVASTISDAVLTADINIEASNVVTSCSTSVPLSSPVTTPSTSPVVLKTKRFLLHEWLQEKSESNTNLPTSPPVIRTEVKWNTTAASSTCYVQCTKDNPHSSGISAAHLRRSSTSSQIKSFPLKSCSEQGSAKKRWLRQAMYDCNSYDDPLTIDPGGIESIHFDNGDLSPNSHGEMGSPGAVNDTVTPLKKRRLMRESVESTLSPVSPTAPNSEAISGAILSSISTEIKTEAGQEDLEQLPSLIKVVPASDLPSKSKEDSLCKIDALKVEQSEIKERANIKEEVLAFNSSVGVSVSHDHKTSLEMLESSVSTNIKGTQPTMQKDCDVTDKTSGDIKIENAPCTDNLDVLQNVTKISDICASNSGTSSVHLCSEKSLQSDCANLSSNSPQNGNESSLCENTSQCSSVKRKITFADDQCNTLPSCISDDNFSCSNKINSTEGNSEISTTFLEAIASEIGAEHTSSEIQKLSEENVNKIISDKSSILPSVCESTKNNFSDSVSHSPELHTSVSSVKNVNVSVSVSLDMKTEQNDSAVNLYKKVLTDVSTSETDEQSCSSSPTDIHMNSNHGKNVEFSDLDSKTSNLSSDGSSLVTKSSCASVTQKRKVSLSEYRMRMKDGTNKRTSSENSKRCTNSPAVSATAIPETLPEQVTLAPLPLFDTASGSRSPTQTSAKISKKKEINKNEEESHSEVTEHRENLTERLKREFGFDDDSEGCTATSIQTKSISGSTATLPLCAQPPPPPPPPPPRPVRPSQSNASTAASPSQFGFSMPTPYARPSYIVPQVPSAQFIPVQQTVTPPVIPSVHSVTTPGVQCTVRPALLPSPHSFAPSLPGTVLQPPIQHEYSSVNAQNFVALVQQPPPPPPPPKSYPPVYQPGLYK